MKLYNSFGMNPRTIRMFLLEKGIEVPTQDVDFLAGDNRKAPFLAKNPAGQLPVLELDDGSFLSESAAICEYLEELHPTTPSLIGKTPQERAETRMWLRRAEINVCIPAVHAFYFKEGYDVFKDRVHCIPEAADGLKTKARLAVRWLDGLLAGRTFLAGERFTVADIVLFTYLDLLRNGGQPLDPEANNVAAWFARVSARPSAEKSLFPVQPMGLRG